MQGFIHEMKDKMNIQMEETQTVARIAMESCEAFSKKVTGIQRYLQKVDMTQQIWNRSNTAGPGDISPSKVIIPRDDDSDQSNQTELAAPE